MILKRRKYYAARRIARFNARRAITPRSGKQLGLRSRLISVERAIHVLNTNARTVLPLSALVRLMSYRKHLE